MRVLITGITGFAGSHLADYCLGRGDVDLFGIVRWRSRTENIEHITDKVKLLECDLRDASSAREVVEEISPDYIFHLAAQSFVPTSWRAPTESLTSPRTRQQGRPPRRSTPTNDSSPCGKTPTPAAAR